MEKVVGTVKQDTQKNDVKELVLDKRVGTVHKMAVKKNPLSFLSCSHVNAVLNFICS